jgi:hypothetical protein
MYMPSLPTATKIKVLKEDIQAEFFEKPVASCFVSVPLGSVTKT